MFQLIIASIIQVNLDHNPSVLDKIPIKFLLKLQMPKCKLSLYSFYMSETAIKLSKM